MTTQTTTSTSEAETMAIAARVARALTGGTVLLLTGDLGAGKSAFVRGLARALGITARIASPTFVLLRAYDVPHHPTIAHLVHVDAYRVHDPRTLLDVELREWLARDDAFIAIEWGERVRDVLPAGVRTATVHMTQGARADERTIVFTH